MRCKDCDRELTSDEIGLSKKLISRTTEVHYCTECLAKRFNLSEAQLRELCEHFRAAGCSLFR